MKSLRMTSVAMLLATTGLLALSGCRIEDPTQPPPRPIEPQAPALPGVDALLAVTNNEVTFFGPPPSVNDAVVIKAVASSITPSGFVAATDDQTVLNVSQRPDGTYAAEAAAAAGLITSRDLGGVLMMCATDPDFNGWPTLAVSTPGWLVTPVEGSDPAIDGKPFDNNFGCGSNDTTQDVTMDGASAAFSSEGVTEPVTGGFAFGTLRAYKLTRGTETRYMVIGTVSVTVDGVQQDKLLEIYLPSAVSAPQ